MDTALRVEDLTVVYRQGTERVVALDHLWMSADEGRIVLVRGPSGCGKTTLLSCLAGILRPMSGSIEVDGIDITRLRRQGLMRHRRSGVGIVFQSFNLVPSMTALENVTTPLLLSGMSYRKARPRAELLLERFGLGPRMGARPGTLSGGEKQRVAIARALVKEPPLLVADEPTSNLDRENAESVVQLLDALRGPGRVVVIATHDDRLLPIADSVVDLIDTGPPGVIQRPPVDLAVLPEWESQAAPAEGRQT